jgi:Transposase DDE domain
MRTRDSIHRKRSPFFGPERFTYEPEHDRYLCPAGQFLNYGGQGPRNHAWTYIGTRKRCGPCALRPQCTSAAFRCLVIHQHEPARQRARELANTPEFARAQQQRKKVEALQVTSSLSVIRTSQRHGCRRRSRCCGSSRLMSFSIAMMEVYSVSWDCVGDAGKAIGGVSPDCPHKPHARVHDSDHQHGKLRDRSRFSDRA